MNTKSDIESPVNSTSWLKASIKNANNMDLRVNLAVQENVLKMADKIGIDLGLIDNVTRNDKYGTGPVVGEFVGSGEDMLNEHIPLKREQLRREYADTLEEMQKFEERQGPLGKLGLKVTDIGVNMLSVNSIADYGITAMTGGTNKVLSMAGKINAAMNLPGRYVLFNKWDMENKLPIYYDGSFDIPTTHKYGTDEDNVSKLVKLDHTPYKPSDYFDLFSAVIAQKAIGKTIGWLKKTDADLKVKQDEIFSEYRLDLASDGYVHGKPMDVRDYNIKTWRGEQENPFYRMTKEQKDAYEEALKNSKVFVDRHGDARPEAQLDEYGNVIYFDFENRYKGTYDGDSGVYHEAQRFNRETGRYENVGKFNTKEVVAVKYEQDVLTGKEGRIWITADGEEIKSSDWNGPDKRKWRTAHTWDGKNSTMDPEEEIRFLDFIRSSDLASNNGPIIDVTKHTVKDEDALRDVLERNSDIIVDTGFIAEYDARLQSEKPMGPYVDPNRTDDDEAKEGTRIWFKKVSEFLDLETSSGKVPSFETFKKSMSPEGPFGYTEMGQTITKMINDGRLTAEQYNTSLHISSRMGARVIPDEDISAVASFLLQGIDPENTEAIKDALSFTNFINALNDLPEGMAPSIRRAVDEGRLNETSWNDLIKHSPVRGNIGRLFMRNIKSIGTEKLSEYDAGLRVKYMDKFHDGNVAEIKNHQKLELKLRHAIAKYSDAPTGMYQIPRGDSDELRHLADSFPELGEFIRSDINDPRNILMFSQKIYYLTTYFYNYIFKEHLDDDTKNKISAMKHDKEDAVKLEVLFKYLFPGEKYPGESLLYDEGEALVKYITENEDIARNIDWGVINRELSAYLTGYFGDNHPIYNSLPGLDNHYEQANYDEIFKKVASHLDNMSLSIIIGNRVSKIAKRVQEKYGDKLKDNEYLDAFMYEIAASKGELYDTERDKSISPISVKPFYDAIRSNRNIKNAMLYGSPITDVSGAPLVDGKKTEKEAHTIIFNKLSNELGLNSILDKHDIQYASASIVRLTSLFGGDIDKVYDTIPIVTSEIFDGYEKKQELLDVISTIFSYRGTRIDNNLDKIYAENKKLAPLLEGLFVHALKSNPELAKSMLTDPSIVNDLMDDKYADARFEILTSFMAPYAVIPKEYLSGYVKNRISDFIDVLNNVKQYGATFDTPRVIESIAGAMASYRLEHMGTLPKHVYETLFAEDDRLDSVKKMDYAKYFKQLFDKTVGSHWRTQAKFSLWKLVRDLPLPYYAKNDYPLLEKALLAMLTSFQGTLDSNNAQELSPIQLDGVYNQLFYHTTSVNGENGHDFAEAFYRYNASKNIKVDTSNGVVARIFPIVDTIASDYNYSESYRDLISKQMAVVGMMIGNINVVSKGKDLAYVVPIGDLTAFANYSESVVRHLDKIIGEANGEIGVKFTKKQDFLEALGALILEVFKSSDHGRELADKFKSIETTGNLAMEVFINYMTPFAYIPKSLRSGDLPSPGENAIDMLYMIEDNGGKINWANVNARFRNTVKAWAELADSKGEIDAEIIKNAFVGDERLDYVAEIEKLFEAMNYSSAYQHATNHVVDTVRLQSLEPYETQLSQYFMFLVEDYRRDSQLSTLPIFPWNIAPIILSEVSSNPKNMQILDNITTSIEKRKNVVLGHKVMQALPKKPAPEIVPYILTTPVIDDISHLLFYYRKTDDAPIIALRSALYGKAMGIPISKAFRGVLLQQGIYGYGSDDRYDHEMRKRLLELTEIHKLADKTSPESIEKRKNAEKLVREMIWETVVNREGVEYTGVKETLKSKVETWKKNNPDKSVEILEKELVIRSLFPFAYIKDASGVFVDEGRELMQLLDTLPDEGSFQWGVINTILENGITAFSKESGSTLPNPFHESNRMKYVETMDSMSEALKDVDNMSIDSMFERAMEVVYGYTSQGEKYRKTALDEERLGVAEKGIRDMIYVTHSNSWELPYSIRHNSAYNAVSPLDMLGIAAYLVQKNSPFLALNTDRKNEFEDRKIHIPRDESDETVSHTTHTWSDALKAYPLPKNDFGQHKQIIESVFDHTNNLPYRTASDLYEKIRRDSGEIEKIMNFDEKSISEWFNFQKLKDLAEPKLFSFTDERYGLLVTLQYDDLYGIAKNKTGDKLHIFANNQYAITVPIDISPVDFVKAIKDYAKEKYNGKSYGTDGQIVSMLTKLNALVSERLDSKYMTSLPFQSILQHHLLRQDKNAEERVKEYFEFMESEREALEDIFGKDSSELAVVRETIRQGKLYDDLYSLRVVDGFNRLRSNTYYQINSTLIYDSELDTYTKRTVDMLNNFYTSPDPNLKTQEEIEVWRGIVLNENTSGKYIHTQMEGIKPGDIIVNRTFTSVGRTQNTPVYFTRPTSDKSKSYLMKIKVPKGSSVLFFTGMESTIENEALLGRGSKIMVTDVQEMSMHDHKKYTLVNAVLLDGELKDSVQFHSTAPYYHVDLGDGKYVSLALEDDKSSSELVLKIDEMKVQAESLVGEALKNALDMYDKYSGIVEKIQTVQDDIDASLRDLNYDKLPEQLEKLDAVFEELNIGKSEIGMMTQGMEVISRIWTAKRDEIAHNGDLEAIKRMLSWTQSAMHHDLVEFEKSMTILQDATKEEYERLASDYDGNIPDFPLVSTPFGPGLVDKYGLEDVFDTDIRFKVGEALHIIRKNPHLQFILDLFEIDGHQISVGSSAKSDILGFFSKGDGIFITGRFGDGTSPILNTTRPSSKYNVSMDNVGVILHELGHYVDDFIGKHYGAFFDHLDPEFRDKITNNIHKLGERVLSHYPWTMSNSISRNSEIFAELFALSAHPLRMVFTGAERDTLDAFFNAVMSEFYELYNFELKHNIRSEEYSVKSRKLTVIDKLSGEKTKEVMEASLPYLPITYKRTVAGIDQWIASRAENDPIGYTHRQQVIMSDMLEKAMAMSDLLRFSLKQFERYKKLAGDDTQVALVRALSGLAENMILGNMAYIRGAYGTYFHEVRKVLPEDQKAYDDAVRSVLDEDFANSFDRNRAVWRIPLPTTTQTGDSEIQVYHDLYGVESEIVKRGIHLPRILTDIYDAVKDYSPEADKIVMEEILRDLNENTDFKTFEEQALEAKIEARKALKKSHIDGFKKVSESSNDSNGKHNGKVVGNNRYQYIGNNTVKVTDVKSGELLFTTTVDDWNGKDEPVITKINYPDGREKIPTEKARQVYHHKYMFMDKGSLSDADLEVYNASQSRSEFINSEMKRLRIDKKSIGYESKWLEISKTFDVEKNKAWRDAGEGPDLDQIEADAQYMREHGIPYEKTSLGNADIRLPKIYSTLSKGKLPEIGPDDVIIDMGAGLGWKGQQKLREEAGIMNQVIPFDPFVPEISDKKAMYDAVEKAQSEGKKLVIISSNVLNVIPEKRIFGENKDGAYVEDAGLSLETLAGLFDAKLIVTVYEGDKLGPRVMKGKEGARTYQSNQPLKYYTKFFKHQENIVKDKGYMVYDPWVKRKLDDEKTASEQKYKVSNEKVILDYTGENYSVINDYLRGTSLVEPSKEDLEQIKILDRMFKSMKPNGEDTILYRGESIPKSPYLRDITSLRVGDEYEFTAFTSTATTDEGAFKYLGTRISAVDLVWEITTNTNDKVLKISPEESTYHEDEVLLNRGTVVIIDEIEVDGSDMTIKAHTKTYEFEKKPQESYYRETTEKTEMSPDLEVNINNIIKNINDYVMKSLTASETHTIHDVKTVRSFLLPAKASYLRTARQVLLDIKKELFTDNQNQLLHDFAERIEANLSKDDFIKIIQDSTYNPGTSGALSQNFPDAIRRMFGEMVAHKSKEDNVDIPVESMAIDTIYHKNQIEGHLYNIVHGNMNVVPKEFIDILKDSVLDPSWKEQIRYAIMMVSGNGDEVPAAIADYIYNKFKDVAGSELREYIDLMESGRWEEVPKAFSDLLSIDIEKNKEYLNELFVMMSSTNRDNNSKPITHAEVADAYFKSRSHYVSIFAGAERDYKDIMANIITGSAKYRSHLASLTDIKKVVERKADGNDGQRIWSISTDQRNIIIDEINAISSDVSQDIRKRIVGRKLNTVEESEQIKSHLNVMRENWGEDRKKEAVLEAGNAFLAKMNGNMVMHVMSKLVDLKLLNILSLSGLNEAAMNSFANHRQFWRAGLESTPELMARGIVSVAKDYSDMFKDVSRYSADLDRDIAGIKDPLEKEIAKLALDLSLGSKLDMDSHPYMGALTNATDWMTFLQAVSDIHRKHAAIVKSIDILARGLSVKYEKGTIYSKITSLGISKDRFNEIGQYAKAIGPKRIIDLVLDGGEQKNGLDTDVVRVYDLLLNISAFEFDATERPVGTGVEIKVLTKFKNYFLNNMKHLFNDAVLKEEDGLYLYKNAEDYTSEDFFRGLGFSVATSGFLTGGAVWSFIKLGIRSALYGGAGLAIVSAVIDAWKEGTLKDKLDIARYYFMSELGSMFGFGGFLEGGSAYQSLLGYGRKYNLMNSNVKYNNMNTEAEKIAWATISQLSPSAISTGIDYSIGMKSLPSQIDVSPLANEIYKGRTRGEEEARIKNERALPIVMHMTRLGEVLYDLMVTDEQSAREVTGLYSGDVSREDNAFVACEILKVACEGVRADAIMKLPDAELKKLGIDYDSEVQRLGANLEREFLSAVNKSGMDKISAHLILVKINDSDNDEFKRTIIRNMNGAEHSGEMK